MPRMSILPGTCNIAKSRMDADMRYRQSRLLRLAAEERLYARALQALSDVDFEAGAGGVARDGGPRLTPWFDTLNARELAVLGLTGDRGLVEAMVQARSDGGRNIHER